MRLGRYHVCRRCAAMYPTALVVAVLQVRGVFGGPWSSGLMWVLPLGVTAEWVLEHLGRVTYSPSRQVVVSLVASVSLGIGLGRHAVHPFEGPVVAAMATYVAVCLSAWWAGTRRGSAAADPGAEIAWVGEFERSELVRAQRLRELLGPDLDLDPAALQDQSSNAVTKSMSSSTAPTSDGSRSL